MVNFSRFNFKNFRNKNGLLVRFDIYKETLFSLKNILNFELVIPKNKKVENIFKFYFLKKLFSEFEKDGLYPLIAHNKSKNLNSQGLSFYLLNPVLFFINRKLKSITLKKKTIVFPNFISLIRLYLYKSQCIYYIQINNHKKCKNILIKYEEGLSNLYQSDLFWYDYSQNINLILFFENKVSLDSFKKNLNDLNFLKKKFKYKYDYKFIRSFKFKNFNFKSNYKDKFFSYENYFIKKLINLNYSYFNNEVKNWKNFIKNLNIDRFIYKSVADNNNIFIYTALNSLGKDTFAYTRSYMMGDPSLNFMWYFADYLFVPGSHSSKLLKLSFNLTNKVKIVGPLNKFTKKNLISNNEILFIDNVVSKNLTKSQVIFDNDMQSILSNLKNISSKLKIKFCIKIKKNSYLNLISKNILLSDKFRFIYRYDDYFFSKFPIVIIIGVFPSSILIELLANRVICIFYDYGGLTKIKNNKDYHKLKNLYIVYDSIDMIVILKKILNKNYRNDNFEKYFVKFNDFRSKKLITSFLTR